MIVMESLPRCLLALNIISFFFLLHYYFILNFVIQVTIDQLEGVDDELDEIGILLVSTPDEEVAQEHGWDYQMFAIDMKLDGFNLLIR